MLKIGEKVKQIRQMLGLSQFDLAQKAELSNDYISKVEKGKISNIGIINLVALTRALERDPAEFLEFYISPQKPKLTLGKKIAAIRKYKKISQEDLAKRSQIRLRALQRIEDDLDEPLSDYLMALSKALKVELKDLIDKEPDKILNVPTSELIDNYVSKALPSVPLSSLDNTFYDKNWLPNPQRETISHERNIRIEEDSAYVVKLGKNDDAMMPIGPGWRLFVSPEVELESGDCVLVGINSRKPNKTLYPDQIVFREALFEGDSLVLKAYNSNYDPIIKKREDILFVHKVIWCKPPGKSRKEEDYEKTLTAASSLRSREHVSLVEYWNERNKG